MPSTIVTEQIINVGQETFIPSDSPATQYSVVFEDNGETAYFYAYDTSQKIDPILDAMHIYNVANVTDSDMPSTLQIAWSSDELKVVLVINRYPHAIFDFQAKRGYCRTNFPSPGTKWSQYHASHEWSDESIELFR